MKTPDTTRRKLLAAGVAAPGLLLLSGCRSSLPRLIAPQSTSAALSLLEETTAAHGAAALATIHDVNVSYAGKWHFLVTKMQPDLVDAGFRGGSEERLLLKEGLVGQSHSGPKGHKQVVRETDGTDQGRVRVWFNDEESHADAPRQAAALVADGYSLFLLGPWWITAQLQAHRPAILELVGTEDVWDGDHRYPCDLIGVRMRPGLGFSTADQLVLYIDRNTRLMRRVRFSLEGLESTRGALVEVDTLDPVSLHGVQWPTRFHERLLRPAPLKVHDWRLTGLDLNRGYDPQAVSGERFGGAAQRAAAPLPV